MKTLLIAALALCALPTFASADRWDRGDRYRRDSRPSFTIGFGYSSGGYRDNYSIGFSYSNYRPVYRDYYYPRPVICEPPVIYRPRPVYYCEPVYYTQPVRYYDCGPTYYGGGYYYR